MDLPRFSLTGEIEAIGSKVTQFHAGNRVWAFTTLRMGCYAQRTCLPATVKLLTTAPSNLNHDEAAAIPYGGLMALHFLGKAKIDRRYPLERIAEAHRVITIGD